MKNSRKSNVRGMVQPASSAATLALPVNQQFLTIPPTADLDTPAPAFESRTPEEERFRAFLTSQLPPLQAPASLAKRIRHLTLNHD